MRLALALAAALTTAVAVPAGAATVWTDWTSATTGAPGSAAGTLDGVSVSYAGEVLSNRVINGSFATAWAPSTSFVGGTVTTSPASVGDIITLAGAFTGTNTLSFSSPVTNPVFAIWSLGQPGSPDSFTFNTTPTFEVGGRNVSFGGSAVSVNGNVVTGSEGNGVLQFTGTFSSISFTSTPEFYYGFTVGMNGPGGVAPIPEPSTWALIIAGLAVVGGVAHRRRRR